MRIRTRFGDAGPYNENLNLAFSKPQIHDFSFFGNNRVKRRCFRKVERFACKTKVISGAGAIRSLGELGSRRLLLVSDPFFAKNGTAQAVLNASGAEKTEIFSDVRPDPSVELVAEATAVMRAFLPDTVAALGGGSAMDCAKAMLHFSGAAARFVAIPTTSGSGSEVTDFSVLTHGTVKYPVIDEKMQPDVAILDGDLLKELPRSLIADAGFDAISHALEAYAAKNGGMLSDCLAEGAFRTVLTALPASYGGDTAVRQKIHTAATMAGMAFSQAGLGLCHALSHSLGGAFHIPHGRLNAILLPAVIRLNATAVQEKYAKLARSAGIPGSADTVAVRNLQNTLIRLRKQLNLPETLQQAGVDPGQVRFRSRELVQAALDDPCCKTNPLPVEDFMVRRILEEVMGRA